MSRNTSDLCTLLVDETYGQLTSQIYQALLTHGRSSLPALRQRTKLDEHQLRNGLSILIQQNLVYWNTSSNDHSTAYEANVSAGYNLVRNGKYIRFIEDRFGVIASKIISHLLVHGYARAGDLVESRSADSADGGHGKSKAAHVGPNGVIARVPKENGRIEYGDGAIAHNEKEMLSELLKAGLVRKVHQSHFRTDADNRTEAEKILPPVEEYKASRKGDRQAMWEAAVQDMLNQWKYGVAGDLTIAGNLKQESKRPLKDSDGPRPKKRQRIAAPLDNASEDVLMEESKGTFADPKYPDNETVLSINHAKFAIHLRSHHLVDIAKSNTFPTTAKVYEKVLQMIEPQLRECKSAKILEDEAGEIDRSDFPPITTEDIAAAVPKSLVATDAFVKVEEDLIQDDLDHPKKRRRKKGRREDEAIDVDARGQEEGEDGSDDEGSDVGSDGNISGVSRDSDSEMDDQEFGVDQKPLPRISLNPHQTAVRSHLLLLSEHPSGFLTRNPRTSSSSPENWMVDFSRLIHESQMHSISRTMVDRYGTPSLRLVNILKQYGRLDEKTLSSLSLIREKEMRNRLTAMQKDGLLELQEVPRDNARLASRTNFLYFFDHDRCMRKLSDEAYKTMTRLLQRARIEKEDVQGTLEKASRSDVVGREEQLLSLPEREALQKWRDTEARILGQVGRVDDLVALLRDY